MIKILKLMVWDNPNVYAGGSVRSIINYNNELVLATRLEF
tara:strand:- start:99 stop:218 length:120 start_codon:yes stop_codon:yes gene_type:complete